MPRIGLEPTHLAAPDPKSGVSTNSTTWAQKNKIQRIDRINTKRLFTFCQVLLKGMHQSATLRLASLQPTTNLL